MWLSFRFCLSQWGVPTIKITDISIIFKWENKKKWQYIKYLFAPLYIQDVIYESVGESYF